MELFEKLKLKNLLFKDLNWELDEDTDYDRIFYRIDEYNKLIIDFDIYDIKIVAIRLRLNNYDRFNNLNRTTIEKRLYLMSSNFSIVRHLRKIKRKLIKIENEENEKIKLKRDMKYLPKSFIRELNIDNILDDIE